ncbi:hypothetical protein ABZ615_17440, partial [Streptomyces sp. NPDC007325]|uniref:hypothetical protein n=1 Tax=Streptomyces sp. NPDC007325 TaxID=3154588 RepID=UPI0033FF15F5
TSPSSTSSPAWARGLPVRARSRRGGIGLGGRLRGRRFGGVLGGAAATGGLGAQQGLEDGVRV